MFNEILLEKVYKDGKYMGKIVTTPEDLKKIEDTQGSILDDINGPDIMGYKKYKDNILEQKKYILKKPKK